MDAPRLSHHKRWKQKNPEAYLLMRARYRAKRFGLPFSITVADISIPTHCPVFGVPMRVGGPRDRAPSIDRLVPERGYVPGNIVVVSQRANFLKGNASIEELQKIAAFYSKIAEQPQIEK